MTKEVGNGVVGKTKRTKTKARPKSILSSSMMRLSGFHLCQISNAKARQLLAAKAR